MKHILISLVLALAFATGTPAQTAAELDQKATDMHWAAVACLADATSATKVEDCGKLDARALALNYEAETLALAERNQRSADQAAQLHTNTAAIEQAAVGLLAATAKLNAYAACRQHRRWWQAWKRRCTL